MRWVAALGCAWVAGVANVAGVAARMTAVLAVLGVDAAAAATPAPAYTDAQAARGRLAYGRACAVCHGADLQGAAAVALAGRNFARTWGDGRHGLHDLYEEVARQMPKNAPGTLSEADNLAVLAYMLARNGYAAGGAPLAPAGMDMTLPAAPAAAGRSGGGISGGGGGAAAAGFAPAAAPGVASDVHYPQPPVHVLQPSGSLPDDAQIAAPAAGDWLTYNRTLAGDRYSPLAQITTRNAGRLQVKCLLQLGELGSFETSPLAYRGRLYLTTVHKVFAVDGSNCAVLWSYDYVPPDPEHLPGNRGLALYRGRLFRGTADGHLICLDAATGRLLWDVRVADAALGYEITGAPVAFDGRVFTGDAGADVGIRGRVYAFDAATGTLVWSFDMIPTGRQPGADTWGPGNAGEHGGGATWSSMALDPATRMLLVPIGNPAPDFNDAARPGSNLYTDSVVALSLDTGRLAWYVQQVPHDVHDWDTAAAPALFEHAGRQLMAVASKNGLLHLYDRDSHELLWRAPFTTRENVAAPLSPDHPVHVCPGALGQYNGPAWSPALQLLFVAAADRCNLIQVAEPRYVPGGVYFGGRFIIDPPTLQSGWIRAFDVSGREVWRLHRRDITLAAVTPTAGGLLLTGDSGGEFLALDARRGEVRYRFQTGGPIAGGITTYLASGRQFIAVPSGSSSRDAASATGSATLVVFSLP
ncbi:MAG TPA: PQQ-binding-like beta-propeller repeat protein [Steroidobacteraceae bacterium]|nr:PQQ-binding-like beta-propeller repeat protein [Steroidobacteraceae bacterium]